MDIIQRNFLRLLRCGAFGIKEAMEPMSTWKWERLYEVSQIHGVTPWIADGIRKCSDDFFLQISPTLWKKFEEDTTDTYESYEEQQLTNPILNRKLQKLVEEAGDEDITFKLLLHMIAIARNILTEGISLRQFIMLGTFLRTTKARIEYDVLKTWIKQLKMERVARLEGSLLMELFMFKAEEIHFTEAVSDNHIRKVVYDIFQMTEKNAANWYFTQGKSIFVKTSDSDAMMWHVKHSAKYLPYYPSEAVTNFMANFAHSLSHIEE